MPSCHLIRYEFCASLFIRGGKKSPDPQEMSEAVTLHRVRLSEYDEDCRRIELAPDFRVEAEISGNNIFTAAMDG